MTFGFRLLYLLSALGTAAAAAAHVLTFADIAFYPVLVLVPLLFVLWPLVLWQYRRIPRKNLFSEIFARVPAAMKVGTGVLLCYAIGNLFLAGAPLEGGSPTRLPEGKLVLKVKDQVRRELTPAEFRHAQALQVRMLTGHLIAFYALAGFAVYACWLKSGPAMANAKIPPAVR
jgi:hypothetical protein